MSRRWMCLLALLVLGCGRVDERFSGPDATPPVVDAATADDSAADAALADGPPPPMGPWSVPRRIDEVSLAGFVDHFPSVRGDGRELFFASNRDGNTQDIYVSTRDATTDPWRQPVLVAELDAGSTESGPDITDDGRTILVSRVVPGSSTGLDIHVATRPNKTAPWNPPTLVSELSTSESELSPHISGDGMTMYFTRGTGDALDIFIATRNAPSEPWQNVKPLNRFNSIASDSDVTTRADDQEAIFESTRDGPRALYVSRRTVDGVFTVPKAIAELDGGFRADITADGRYMVLTMIGPDGTADLYESTRE